MKVFWFFQRRFSDVWLRELTRRDVLAFYELVQTNREHLTQFGDYRELIASTLQDIESYFSDPPDQNTRMGIWRGADELMGRVDLSPVEPGMFVLHDFTVQH